MITSHRACRKSSQNLWLHSAEHYIHTDIHTYHLFTLHLSLSDTVFHIQLCPTQLFYLLDPSPPPSSFLPSPSRYNICCSWSTHTHTPHTQLITTQLPHTHNFLTPTYSHTGSLLHTPILHHLFSLSWITHAIFTFIFAAVGRS